jgi:hypothetical protein
MSTTVRIDRYVVDVLMRDIVGHDARPSAYVIYLYFATRSRRATALSHAELASATGLSKPTAVPFYRVLKPWRHKPRR